MIVAASAYANAKLMSDNDLDASRPWQPRATAAAAARAESASGISPLAALVQGMAEGRQDALARLYDQTSPLVNGLLLRMLEHREDAEEALLDVYMKAWKNAAGYSPGRGSVQSWLIVMARSIAIDRIRHKHAQPKTSSLESENAFESVSPDASPEEQTAAWQRRGKVQSLLLGLPPEQREVLVMAFFGGFSHSELAERLGQPMGTVKSRIRMALLRLRSLLEEGNPA